MEQSSDFFVYSPEHNHWITEFRRCVAFVSCSTDINPTVMTPEQMQVDKPVYLAVMAHKQQLQPILDNPHLFDPALVNAVKLLFIQYDNFEIVNHD